MNLNAIIGNIPSFLHQLDTSSIGLGDLVGAIALIVSAITFYISYAQSSQSEQIKGSRELWTDIKILLDKVSRKEEPRQNSYKGLIEIDYFAYLIMRGEINDRVVIDYYREGLIEAIMMNIRAYCREAVILTEEKTEEEFFKEVEKEEFRLWERFSNIVQLIIKWEVPELGEKLKPWRLKTGGGRP